MGANMSRLGEMPEDQGIFLRHETMLSHMAATCHMWLLELAVWLVQIEMSCECKMYAKLQRLQNTKACKTSH